MANLCESHTMKLFLALLHEITESDEGSSTISKVLIKNGGVPKSCKASIGCGEEDDDAAPPPPPPVHAAALLAVEAVGVSSSSIFTMIPSIRLNIN